jgi:hypothetical protein
LKNKTKKDWGHGLGGKAPAWQLQGPELKIQYRDEKNEY